MDINKLDSEIKDLKLKLRDLRNVDADKRAEVGAKLNARLREAEEEYRAIERKIKQDEVNAKLACDKLVDVTAPDLNAKCGHLHPITRVIRELEKVFTSMGFYIEPCNEIVTEFECLDSVNMPKNHPARDMQDTFWLENKQLLTTQNSALQNYLLRKYGPEFRVFYHGRCFRNEATDARHENTFFQVEGMVVGKDVSIANLIHIMQTAFGAVFKKDLQVRLRPSFFPFVEPGFDMDISCPFCDSGCAVCKRTKWIEFGGCGMVHPKVLEMGGVDPKVYQGFAFCFGITRLAMIQYGIDDIRHFNSGNLEFLRGVK
jgi:phenylalanyl-tRNA synthetase alpha chain